MEAAVWESWTPHQSPSGCSGETSHQTRFISCLWDAQFALRGDHCSGAGCRQAFIYMCIYIYVCIHTFIWDSSYYFTVPFFFFFPSNLLGNRNRKIKNCSGGHWPALRPGTDFHVVQLRQKMRSQLSRPVPGTWIACLSTFPSLRQRSPSWHPVSYLQRSWKKDPPGSEFFWCKTQSCKRKTKLF